MVTVAVAEHHVSVNMLCECVCVCSVVVVAQQGTETLHFLSFFF
jgi:hypothetical protein